MKRRVLILNLFLILLLATSMFLALGCGSKQTSTTTIGNTTSTGTSPVTSSSPLATQTLKIGYILDMSAPSPLDSRKAVDALVAQDNKNGGWDIGGQKYQVQVIAYDGSTSDQAKETAAVNRLIFEDKVKYILDMGNFVTADLPITETNNVININMPIVAAMTMNPSVKLSYGSSGLDLTNAAFWGWMAQNYSLASKSVIGAFPENMIGHIIESSTNAGANPFGVTVTPEYYPATSQDFSAIGTLIASLNPDFFMTQSGSDNTDALVFNAVRQAGYKGQFITETSATAQVLSQTMTPDALNGIILTANATEFNPMLTQTAQDIKNAWIAKYGANSWTDPYLPQLPGFFMLKAALQQAGSLDVDKVSAVLNNGMKFDTLNGPAQMFARTDLGNDRTVDAAFTVYIKQIVDGQPKLMKTINTDDAIKDFHVAFPPLPAGATLPAGGPSGPPPS